MDIAASRKEHERVFAFMADALQTNRSLIKGSISPLPAMCANDACILEYKGAPLYFDNNHPNLSSAPFYSRIIEDQISAAN
jgi:hypothetical protein